jgi:DNA adenine methylase
MAMALDISRGRKLDNEGESDVKSPISWVGGKSKLTKILLPLFPEHKCYVEVFGGAGWVLFAKEPSKVEILNDYDVELMNFWSVVQNAPEQFIESFKYELVSRSLFNEYKQKFINKDFDDAIERAKIFYYLVRAGFAAKMNNHSFGTGSTTRNGLKLERVQEDIEAAFCRLQTVTIECKSFEDMFCIYDGPDTFFYLDSPYRNTTDYRVGKFTDQQYSLLAECCRNTKGKWLYTINDDPFIRELFKGFNTIDHDVFYSISRTENGRRNFKELIITNYDPGELRKTS